MRHIVTFVSALSLVGGMMPVFSVAADENIIMPSAPEISVEDQTVLDPSDMLHFVLDVRWGNVEGEVTVKDETIFDGSVSVPAGDHVSLRKALLFEDNDTIATKVDPVAWTSKIYGSWDGVRVLVSVRASDTVTIATEQGLLAKTAQELFVSGAPILHDVGKGREIVVRARPMEKRGFFLAMGWGRVDRNEPPPALPSDGTTQMTDSGSTMPPSLIDFPRVDFSGSATLAGGGKMMLMKPLRFESNDGITSRTETSVAWTSDIAGGVDGLLLRVHPDRTIDSSDTLTVAFTALAFTQSFPVTDLFHGKIARVSVPVSGQTGYELFFKVIEHPDHKLMRARNDQRVWAIEDGERHHVISPDAFQREGFRWEDVEVTTEENVAIYPEGDPKGYEDGTLIKGSGPPVWVLSNGERRHIHSPQAFERLGYKWKRITEVPDSDIAQYPETTPVTETSDAPDGSLIQVEGLPTVYQIKSGKRLPIPSLAVFSGNKFGWENVMEVRQDIRDVFPQGKAVGYPDGTLLASSDGKVHVVENGERQWVRTASDFSGRGFDWGQVRHVGSPELASYPEGSTFELEDLR